MTELTLNRGQYLEFEKLCLGVFLPLRGFMNADEFQSAVNSMRLPTGEPFPLPVCLDIDAATAARLRGSALITLVFGGIEVGTLELEDIFTCDKNQVAQKIFGTADLAHPGAKFLFEGGDYFAGGKVNLKQRVRLDVSTHELTPLETRAEFARRGWKKIVGFQTRNVPHRAHEYLQRIALEISDGIFIQPLIGRKKSGDYAPEAIITGYKTLIEQFLPADRVVFGVLTANMRYAGPREAVFHAIIRRNYGCTHFIVGRDHAGVGNYYGRYEAHDLIQSFGEELGIIPLCLAGPYYCALCDGIVTERTCQHASSAPNLVKEISGTDIRQILVSGREPDPRLLRPEVLASLTGIQLFIE